MPADIGATLVSWSSTDGSNLPSGTTSVSSNLDDNIRTLQGVVVRGLSHKGADIASAATTDLGAVEGLFHDITGTTPITSFGTVRVGIWKILQFDSAVPITHNATSLVIPGGANITTATGDMCMVSSEGSGNWRMNWFIRAAVSPSAGFTTGDVKMTIKTVADSGWVLMDDGTIGNASSGGTTRANADTSALFTLLWNNTTDANCAVSGGRGANAAADYGANKTIALPKSLGRALAVYGAGSGLTSRALAQVAGTETHTLATSEIPAHTHAAPYETNSANGGGGGARTVPLSGGSLGADTGSTGGGGAHNNMQPTVFLNVLIKL